MKPDLTKKGKKLLLKGKLNIKNVGGINLVCFDSISLTRTGFSTFRADLHYGKHKIFTWDNLPPLEVGDSLHLSGIFQSHVSMDIV